MPRYPYIAQGALYPAEGSGPIAWSAWIRELTTFAYQDDKRYLGRGEDLTLQRFCDVAQQLARRSEAPDRELPVSSGAPASFSPRSSAHTQTAVAHSPLTHPLSPLLAPL